MRQTSALPKPLRVESVTRSVQGVLFEHSVSVSPGGRFTFEIGVASP